MTDPEDKLLIDAVLSSRPRRSRRDLEDVKLATMRPKKAGDVAAVPAVDPDDDQDPDDEDLDLEDEDDVPDTTDPVHRDHRRGGHRGRPHPRRHGRPREALAVLGRGALHRGAGGRGAGRGHDRDRRPGPHVPQGDRQGRPPHGRGGGRPGQGDRAGRADHRGAVEGGRLAPRVDPPRHRAQDADQQAAAPAAVRPRDAQDGGRRHRLGGRGGPPGGDAGLPPRQGRPRTPRPRGRRR